MFNNKKPKTIFSDEVYNNHLEQLNEIKNKIIYNSKNTPCKPVNFNKNMDYILCEFYTNNFNEKIFCWVNNIKVFKKTYRHPYKVKYNYLYNRYRHMINRCNNNTSMYGEYYNEYSVSKRWSNKDNGFFCYVYDVIRLENFNEKLIKNNKMQLDKDYKYNPKKIYSKDTVTWLTNKQNILLSKDSYSLIVYDKLKNIRYVGNGYTISKFTKPTNKQINQLIRNDRYSTKELIGKKFNLNNYKFKENDLGYKKIEIEKINNSPIIFLKYNPNI